MKNLFNDDSQSEQVDYAEILHRAIYQAKIVLRRFWWVLPTIVSLGVAYKAVETFLAAPNYRSDAQMMVSGRIALPENELYAEERANFFGTQIELMQSAPIKSRAVDRVKLTHPESYEALEQSEAYRKEGYRSFAGQADAVLFTVRCAHTQARQIKPAIARLKERNINVDGIVLNYLDAAQPGYYYYRYSEYYTSTDKSDGRVKSAEGA